MSYTIVHNPQPQAEDVNAIVAPLRKFNQTQGPPMNYQPVALALTDEHGVISGGLWGKCVYDWLYVEFLSVPEDARRSGLGTQLLAQAESLARAYGCVGIWLDTFSFQALPFYEKVGFRRFGQIDDHPPGGARYFLEKRLT